MLIRRSANLSDAINFAQKFTAPNLEKYRPAIIPQTVSCQKTQNIYFPSYCAPILFTIFRNTLGKLFSKFYSATETLSTVGVIATFSFL